MKTLISILSGLTLIASLNCSQSPQGQFSCGPQAIFTVTLVDNYTIKIKATGCLFISGPETPDERYKDRLSLVDLFQEDMFGGSTTVKPMVYGHFDNKLAGSPTVEIGSGGTIAQSDGGTSDKIYDLMFKAPNNDKILIGGTVNGEIDVRVSHLPEVNLKDIIQRSGTVGTVEWTLPGSRGVVIGSWVVIGQ